MSESVILCHTFVLLYLAAKLFVTSFLAFPVYFLLAVMLFVELDSIMLAVIPLTCKEND